jgi:hypothetical protein
MLRYIEKVSNYQEVMFIFLFNLKKTTSHEDM